MKSKVHPRYKTKYRVANWAAYNQALVRRGDVTGRCCMKTDSCNNADVYHGRRPAILTRREQIKQRTLTARRRENLGTPHHAAQRREVPLPKQPQWSGLV